MTNQGTKELTEHFLDSLILPIGLVSVKVWPVIVLFCEVSAFQGTQSITTTQPWEMVAVDVLKVPTSTKGNQYLLVVQDYFSKWPFSFPM